MKMRRPIEDSQLIEEDVDLTKKEHKFIQSSLRILDPKCKFTQSSLGILDPKWVKHGHCSGLTLEYARHHHSKKDLADFGKKLTKKLDELRYNRGNENFRIRVQQYQGLQASRVITAKHSEINKKNFIELGFLQSLPKDKRDFNILGISTGDHIIAVRSVKSSETSLRGYEIFDSNIGIIECPVVPGATQESIDNLLEIKLEKLFGVFKYLENNHESVCISDLSAVVKESDLTSSTNFKYLDGKKFTYVDAVPLTASLTKATLIFAELSMTTFFSLFLTVGVTTLFLGPAIISLMGFMCSSCLACISKVNDIISEESVKVKIRGVNSEITFKWHEQPSIKEKKLPSI
jgi:hypothetical protein